MTTRATSPHELSSASVEDDVLAHLDDIEAITVRLVEWSADEEEHALGSAVHPYDCAVTVEVSAPRWALPRVAERLALAYNVLGEASTSRGRVLAVAVPPTLASRDRRTFAILLRARTAVGTHVMLYSRRTEVKHGRSPSLGVLGTSGADGHDTAAANRRSGGPVR
jgi:hypothetical protein